MARVASLEALLRDLLGQSDEILKRSLRGTLFKRNGSFHLGKLAELVGLDCEQATFRQNKALRERIEAAEIEIRGRGLHAESSIYAAASTKQAIGKLNEARFLEWLEKVGSEEVPAPVSHNGRLYRKSLWATYSCQALLDITSVPTWFNSRPVVKQALDKLDLKVVQKTVVTISMDSDSIADDMEDSMTSALVRKLRTEVKALKEQLTAERHARERAELAAKQNAWQASLVTTGKMPHKQ